MKENVTEFHVPSNDEIERAKLDFLTYREAESSFFDYVKSTDYVHIFDTERLDRLRDLAYQLGFSDDFSCSSELHWNRPQTDHWGIVDNGIRNRLVTTDFLSSWAHIHYQSGIYMELFLAHDRGHEDFKRAMKGLRQSTLVHEHWYAHWILARTPDLNAGVRTAAGLELAQLCLDVRKGEVDPCPPYPREWYVRMLEMEELKPPQQYHKVKLVPTGILKSTYIKLTRDRLQLMAGHPDLTLAVLPP